MSIRGRKPKAPGLKLVTGNPGRRPITGVNPSRTASMFPEIECREEPLKPPKKLTKVQERLWKRFIDTAWWLTDHDVPNAYVWICLAVEQMKSPTDMIASRIAQYRALAADLGLSTLERERLGISKPNEKDDPTEKFFS